MKKRSALAYQIALHQTDLLGPKRYRQLIELASDISEVFTKDFIDNLASLESVPQRLIENLRKPDWKSVDATIAWHQQPQNQILTLIHELYPEQLREIPDPPPLLYVMGEAAQLSQQQIALVGSRKPSKYGEAAAKQLCYDLSELGYTITSGLAYGIDSSAHIACVEHQRPTIAVMGRGLAEIYPKRHTKLAERILETGGALVSEFPTTRICITAKLPKT